MNYTEAAQQMSAGNKIKLPEWIGYWFYDKVQEQIAVLDRFGNTGYKPYVQDYINRTDWEVTDGLRDFGGALVALKAGKAIARMEWNGINGGIGNKIFVYLNKGSIDHQQLKNRYPTVESIDVLLFEAGDTDTVTRLPNLNMVTKSNSIITGWLPTMVDILSSDWIIVGSHWKLIN